MEHLLLQHPNWTMLKKIQNMSQPHSLPLNINNFHINRAQKCDTQNCGNSCKEKGDLGRQSLHQTT